MAELTSFHHIFTAAQTDFHLKRRDWRKGEAPLSSLQVIDAQKWYGRYHTIESDKSPGIWWGQCADDTDITWHQAVVSLMQSRLSEATILAPAET